MSVRPLATFDHHERPYFIIRMTEKSHKSLSKQRILGPSGFILNNGLPSRYADLERGGITVCLSRDVQRHFYICCIWSTSGRHTRRRDQPHRGSRFRLILFVV